MQSAAENFVLFKIRWPCCFAIILVNSRVGLPRCAIFTATPAILSRKQAASILAKKVELLLRKVDLSGNWEVLQNVKWFFVLLRERHKKFCADIIFLPIFRHSQCTSSPNLTEASKLCTCVLVGTTVRR